MEQAMNKFAAISCKVFFGSPEEANAENLIEQLQRQLPQSLAVLTLENYHAAAESDREAGGRRGSFLAAKASSYQAATAGGTFGRRRASMRMDLRAKVKHWEVAQSQGEAQ